MKLGRFVLCAIVVLAFTMFLDSKWPRRSCKSAR